MAALEFTGTAIEDPIQIHHTPHIIIIITTTITQAGPVVAAAVAAAIITDLTGRLTIDQE